MIHKKIRIPHESANEIMRALGNLNNSIEFEDLTKNNIEEKKSFAEMIKRCEIMRKKIYDYTKICYDFHIPYRNYEELEQFNRDLSNDMKLRDKKFGLTYFDLIENEILENDKKINELVDSHSQIREDLISLIEKKHVLLKVKELIKTNSNFSNFSGINTEENRIKDKFDSNLDFLVGAILSENEMKMKRMIFRISRGRAITAFYSLEINNDEYLLTSTVRTREINIFENNRIGRLQKLSSLIQRKNIKNINTQKKIFTIIFTGSEENILLKKLLKVCEVFQASRYSIPNNSEILNEIEKIEEEIRDKKKLIISIEKNLRDFCILNNNLGKKQGYKYSLYKFFFEQEKVIYTNLNKCIIREVYIDGMVWIPKHLFSEVASLLRNLFLGNKENKASAYLEDIPFNEEKKPPTLINSNEFTYAFQLIVNTYGIPRYREINPGYFTIITFPFLFGVMFGDIGHGLILFLFSTYICLYNDKLSKGKSILKPLLFARYFLLIMGIFSIYCGFLYNEFLSIPIDFGSCYNIQNLKKYNTTIKIEKCNYKFGLDPIWYMSNNELEFVNSLKMKLSVIFGVFQMILGILIKGLNSIFEKDFVEFFFVFFPQLILMVILFGYMDLLIIIKWNTNYEIEHREGYNINYNYCAPDIKTYLMNIFLKLGKLPAAPTPPTYKGKIIQNLKYNDWNLLAERNLIEKLHLWILFISFFSIITMLLPKILINYSKSKEKAKMDRVKQVLFIDIDNKNEQSDNEFQGLKEKNFQHFVEFHNPSISEFILPSAIETIEFALGSISNTASYLRLWALSLAHSQLSLVFFSKTIGYFGTLTNSWIYNGFLLVIIFPIFAITTSIVLLFMDLMECFLHTLRLHWVEFQNKFYRADGYQFKPFCFSQNLSFKNEEFIEE